MESLAQAFQFVRLNTKKIVTDIVCFLGELPPFRCEYRGEDTKKKTRIAKSGTVGFDIFFFYILTDQP